MFWCCEKCRRRVGRENAIVEARDNKQIWRRRSLSLTWISSCMSCRVFRSWAGSFSPKWDYWKVEVSRAIQQGIMLLRTVWKNRSVQRCFFVHLCLVLIFFFSSREEVSNHCVKWGTDVNFSCKMTANASTGVLDACNYRVSIRKVGLLQIDLRTSRF